MKSIDELLTKSSAPRPRRSLHGGFSQRVTARIADTPSKRSGFMWFHGLRPALMAALVVVIIGTLGSASYASTGGFSFLSAIFSGQKTLQNGDTVVTVKTNGCAAEWYDMTKQNFSSDDSTLYFRLKKGSPLTPKQVTQMVQGRCEMAKADARRPQIVRRLERLDTNNTDENLIGGFEDNTVIAISKAKLTIKTNEDSYNGNDKVVATDINTRTYRQLASNMIVETKDGQPLELSQIHPGDHITIMYRMDGSSSTDSSSYSTNTDGDTVVYIMRNSANIVFASAFDRDYGNDFTRISPCTTDDSGYCTE